MFTWAQYLVATAIVIVCLLLVIIVLLQKGRGGGLTAAFGGSSGSAFGAKTGDVFTWITVAFAALYLILNVSGNYLFRQTAAEIQPVEVTATPVDSADPSTQPASGTPTGPQGLKLEPVSLEEVLQNTAPQAAQPAEDPAATPPTPAPTDQPVEQEPQPTEKPSEEEAKQPSDSDDNS